MGELYSIKLYINKVVTKKVDRAHGYIGINTKNSMEPKFSSATLQGYHLYRASWMTTSVSGSCFALI